MRLTSLAIVLFLSFGACTSAKPVTPPAPPAPVEPATLGALAKVHVAGGIYLAGQPASEDFAALPELGVRTVINLRTAKEQADFDERARVEGLGLAYVNVPFGGPGELDDAIFSEVRTRLAAPGPMLLHCASANRVGAVWIPFRVLDQGVELEAAVAEAKSIGLKSPELEAKARDYVARHAPKP